LCLIYSTRQCSFSAFEIYFSLFPIIYLAEQKKYHQWIIETFFSLEYAGELRIIVLKGEEESYIDSHTDTLKTHTETHTSTHAQGKQKTQDHLLFRAPETQLRPDQSVNG